MKDKEKLREIKIEQEPTQVTWRRCTQCNAAQMEFQLRENGICEKCYKSNLEKENAELKKENELLKAEIASLEEALDIEHGLGKDAAGEIELYQIENAELKRDKTELVNSVTELESKVTELEEQIEKMENCWNCKFFKEKKYQACIDYKKNNTKCCAFYKLELAE